MKKYHLSGRLWIFFLGIGSTIWFLIRVIPKPSRAAYPCMQASAPFMSGFVVYLISLGGTTLAFQRARHLLKHSRCMAAGAFILVVLAGLVYFLADNASNSHASNSTKTGPDDGPNQPMGQGQGVNPGRVIWVWDPKATNPDCINAFDLYKPENTNQEVVTRMVADAVQKLSNKGDLRDSWIALFQSFNARKGKTNKAYTQGEKIFIKINQGTANYKLSERDRRNGFFISERLTESQDAKEGFAGTCETYPNVVLEIIRELVNVVGVDQKNIAIGDPISHIYGHNFAVWSKEFPDVVYVDKSTSDFGRTRINPTSKDLLFYSDKEESDKLYDIIENADYMINVANLKPHGRAGVSLTAKNHFGSQARNSAFHLHHSLVSPVSLGNPTNSGYHKYRVMVDLMGSRYLGQNTLLYVVDGLYGGGSNETRVPVKYFMPPFNNNWSSSIFISQDQVALESVCYDFLRTEWNGTYKHSRANNAYETIPNVNGVDDYLHQAADPANWPAGIVYDPDHSGKPLASLGVHEHWNNAEKKQYSRNLGSGKGIELISIPENLVGGDGGSVSGSKNGQLVTLANSDQNIKQETSPSKKSGIKETAGTMGAMKISVENRSFNGTFKAKSFYSVTIDDENTKWFMTEKGIVSFDGKVWTLQDKNKKIAEHKLKGLASDFTEMDHQLWIASPQGATVASLPISSKSAVSTYSVQNSAIQSNNVVSVTVGKGSIHWFGTDKGISAFHDKKWSSAAYQEKYPEFLFKDYPIKAMATSPDGDSLYVATEGAGVTRVFRNDVDAISGASEYAQWDSILIPSDKVYSICITPNGTQWFGTDAGAARHIGYKTLEGWTAFTTDQGLANNFVQSIAYDKTGKIWFGTKAGISVFDGSSWSSFTEKDGLISDNVLCISVDREGIVWMGTDEGVASYFNGKITCFK